MTEKKNNQNKPVSRTPALDRLLRFPQGFTEKLKNHPEEEVDTSAMTGGEEQKKPQGQKRGTRKPASKQPEQKTQGEQKPRQQRSRQKKAPTEQVQQSAQKSASKRPRGEKGEGGKNLRQQPRKQSPKAQSGELSPAAQSRRSSQSRKGGKSRLQRKTPLKIISLGGLGEIGKNITVYECENDIVVVDCGIAFPDDDLLGVDLVIPDFTYLVRNREKVRGIFITHGHEDHIGGLAYLLKEVNVPVYGTPLTIGLIEGKLKEHGLLNKSKLNVVHPRDVIQAGCMSVEFIHVNHSIPDACALTIRTPAGVVIQTGDFKIDYTPIEGDVIDLARFGELGNQGVLALLGDSTNAEKPGSTPSERTVGYSFEKLFHDAGQRRIIIATFASNVHRIQQVIDAAVRTGRKVAVFGRSMVNVVQKATELGYLTVEEGTIIDIETMKNYTDDQLVIISTGSQGEPMSALTRMSTGDHRKVHIGPNDYIIISATPIPGNEKLVGKVVNELMKSGAEVIYERMYDVHVSGHACQDETRTLLALTRPRFFMPVHGEYKHLVKNAQVARSMGYDEKNIIISDIGKVVETDGVDMKITGMVPSGRVLVDGLGVGDVGSIVLRDRKLLSEDGLVVAVVSIDGATGEILAGPDLVSRGFVYVREAEDMMTDAKTVVRRALEGCQLTGFKDWGSIKGKIRDELSEYIYTRTKRKPMILPVIQEI